MPTKILIDGTIFSANPFGGIARLYREILPRIAERNQDILFYILCEKTVSSLPQHDRILPLYFYSWNYRPARIFSILNTWRKQYFNHQIQQLGPDIFHSTYYTLPPVRDVKSVAMVYDLIDYEFPFIMPNGPDFLARQSNVLSQADHVIGISHSTMDRAISAFNLDKDRTATVHLDASSIFQPDTKNNRAEFRKKYTRGRPFFLFVGKISPHKNLATLIRAFGAIRDHTNHLLLLAGHSLRKVDQQYFDLAIQHQVEDRIVRLIHPDDSVLCQAYNASDAFVFPSLQEGFGIPLVEAMRSGTPILASDIPVFREICGKAALFFNPHDAVQLATQLSAVIEPGVKEKMSLAGRERAELYSWKKAAEQIEKIYLELVSQGPGFLAVPDIQSKPDIHGKSA